MNPALPLQRLTLGLPLIAVALASSSVPAAAQLTVFDPVNQQQNLLSATRALQQINNQLRQLQADAQMLSRMTIEAPTPGDGKVAPETLALLACRTHDARQASKVVETTNLDVSGHQEVG